MELNKQTTELLLNLCEVGDALIEKEKYDEGIKKYNEALALIPEPRNQLEATTWVYAAIGDAYFLQKDFATAKKHFMEALNYRGGMTNAFVLLRVGECFYNLNDLEKARKFLLRAYKLEGTTLFENEDPCYLELVLNTL